MRLHKSFIVVAALALLAAGCSKESGPNAPNSNAPRAGTPPPQTQVNTPSTPANAGATSQAEKKDGTNPVQGQVDPKDAAQQRDFKQPGDQKGPTSADTQPK